ncbi:MAG: fumarate hydratase [Solobacterium sp.]|nr:fumarate hydratase [Solobacterium sp.]MBR2830000.1 fumarate hydratase [Solobacterium sp.]MBR3127196.1 fumarate hydratase [Solobacterium sp.]
MRDVDVSIIENKLREACMAIAVEYSHDIICALRKGEQEETREKSKAALRMLLDNAEIASREQIAICQDTGMAIVWVKAGQEVHFTGGSLIDAINRGVAAGYHDGYLRASVVADPLFDRKNTKTNTPAVVYCEIVPGDEVEVEVMAKGFGSENKSKIKMLTPADGVEGVKKFVLDTIKEAGPNACPPMIVGVGIGGTFDSCAVMAKKAMLRPISQSNPDERYKQLEDELLEAANELNVGPMGLHGKTTALKIQVEHFPTHIAGLPCAVNICCHVCRHARMVI